MLRIALVDDHQVLRGGVRGILDGNPDLEVVAEAEDAQSAYRLAQSARPDVFVVDIGLPGPDGFAATREIKRLLPTARILLFTMHAREEFVVRGFDSGATGYATKDMAPDLILEAVRSVGRGTRWVAPKLRTPRLEELLARGSRGVDPPFSHLTQREREIFDLHVRGLSNEEVAKHLFISVKTVETHRANIFRKLRVHSMSEMIRLAAIHGLVQEQ